MFVGLSQQGLNQPFAASRALAGRVDGNRSNLSQVRTVKMKRAAADDLAVIFQHHEIADILANLGKGPGQQGSVAGISCDQAMNLLGVRKQGFTRAHGLPPEWIPLSFWPR